MSEPRVVTPEEAEVYMTEEGQSNGDIYDLAHTVATEPDRIRSAVENAMQSAELLLGNLAEALMRQKSDEEHYRYHESDRIAAAQRAAVVKALTHLAESVHGSHGGQDVAAELRAWITECVDAIENGADW